MNASGLANGIYIYSTETGFSRIDVFIAIDGWTALFGTAFNVEAHEAKNKYELHKRPKIYAIKIEGLNTPHPWRSGKFFQYISPKDFYRILE
ncbi:MAG: hypothetical protein D8M58_18525 [Calditrichaeota bacterium]|nr:MAG: hypothetical protein DWQ03_11755 [Calditrichota bacterium]MBL1207406.1 hypothetical protein [Calditrichota bacterium]